VRLAEEKSWMPACAGMTLKLLRVTSKAIWYYTSGSEVTKVFAELF
jgi:hypothetical protein